MVVEDVSAMDTDSGAVPAASGEASEPSLLQRITGDTCSAEGLAVLLIYCVL